MKPTIFIIVCSIVFLVITPNCEGGVLDSTRNIGLLVKTNVGVNILLNNPKTYYRATDLMFNNSDDKVYYRFFSVALFFHKYLGFEISSEFIRQNADWRSELDKEISSMYPDYYKEYPSIGFDELKKQNIMFGLNSKFQVDDIFIYSRLLIGATIMSQNIAAYEVKAKNRNQTFVVTYIQNPSNLVCLTYNAGFSFVYYFWKHIGINLDVDYCQYYNKLNYEVTNTNMVTGERKTEIFNYNGTLRSFSIGIGLSYFLSFQKSKKKVK